MDAVRLRDLKNYNVTLPTACSALASATSTLKVGGKLAFPLFPMDAERHKLEDSACHHLPLGEFPSSSEIKAASESQARETS